MTRYFQKLPVVYYDRAPAKNIMARADLSKYTRDNAVNFYPHTMEDGDRVDMIADLYYDDPDYSWLIWFANDTIDPYYDTVLNEESFLAFINKKYGSLAEASFNTKYYLNNWAENTDQTLDIGGYESLPANLKKYWSPIVDANFTIIGFQRKRADWTVNTNKILALTTEETANTFQFGDTIYKMEGQELFATGFVMYSNSTSITVQHVLGEFTNEAYVVTSRYSNNSANVIAVDIIQENLDDAEAIYYSPVSFLDWEEQQNAQKKEIKLIDNRLAQQATAELRRVLKE